MVAARVGIKLGMKVAKNLYKGYKLGKRSKALPTMTKVAQKSAKRALTRVGVAAKRSKATSKMAFNPFKSSATKSKAFKKSLKSSKSAVSSLKKASKQTNAVKALNKANQKVLQGSGGKAAKLGRSVGASSTKSKIGFAVTAAEAGYLARNITKNKKRKPMTAKHKAAISRALKGKRRG